MKDEKYIEYLNMLSKWPLILIIKCNEAIYYALCIDIFLCVSVINIANKTMSQVKRECQIWKQAKSKQSLITIIPRKLLPTLSMYHYMIYVGNNYNT